MFSQKGYNFSKILIYLIDERTNLNADVMKKNEKLKILIKLRFDYNIPLVILLTHSDNYCDEVKGQDENWKEICKKNLQENKNNLLNYINNIIKEEYKSNFIIREDNIIHVVLIEQKEITNEITNEEIIEKFDENTRNVYEQSNEIVKNSLIKAFRDGRSSTNGNEVKNFLRENNVFGKNELIKKMKLLLPSQYHNTLNNIN